MGNTTRKAVEAVESDAYLGDGEDSPDLEAVDDQDALSPSSTADSATQFAPPLETVPLPTIDLDVVDAVVSYPSFLRGLNQESSTALPSSTIIGINDTGIQSGHDSSQDSANISLPLSESIIPASFDTSGDLHLPLPAELSVVVNEEASCQQEPSSPQIQTITSHLSQIAIQEASESLVIHSINSASDDTNSGKSLPKSQADFPLLHCYADATNLAAKNPEKAAEILSLPLASASTSVPKPAFVPSPPFTPAPVGAPHTAERPNWALAPDDPPEAITRLDEQRHTAERPNWALAPNDPPEASMRHNEHRKAPKKAHARGRKRHPSINPKDDQPEAQSAGGRRGRARKGRGGHDASGSGRRRGSEASMEDPIKRPTNNWDSVSKFLHGSGFRDQPPHIPADSPVRGAVPPQEGSRGRLNDRSYIRGQGTFQNVPTENHRPDYSDRHVPANPASPYINPGWVLPSDPWNSPKDHSTPMIVQSRTDHTRYRSQNETMHPVPDHWQPSQDGWVAPTDHAKFVSQSAGHVQFPRLPTRPIVDRADSWNAAAPSPVTAQPKEDWQTHGFPNYLDPQVELKYNPPPHHARVHLPNHNYGYPAETSGQYGASDADAHRRYLMHETLASHPQSEMIYETKSESLTQARNIDEDTFHHRPSLPLTLDAAASHPSARNAGWAAPHFDRWGGDATADVHTLSSDVRYGIQGSRDISREVTPDQLGEPAVHRKRRLSQVAGPKAAAEKYLVTTIPSGSSASSYTGDCGAHFEPTTSKNQGEISMPDAKWANAEKAITLDISAASTDVAASDQDIRADDSKDGIVRYSQTFAQWRARGDRSASESTGNWRNGLRDQSASPKYVPPAVRVALARGASPHARGNNESPITSDDIASDADSSSASLNRPSTSDGSPFRDIRLRANNLDSVPSPSPIQTSQLEKQAGYSAVHDHRVGSPLGLHLQQGVAALAASRASEILNNKENAVTHSPSIPFEFNYAAQSATIDWITPPATAKDSMNVNYFSPTQHLSKSRALPDVYQQVEAKTSHTTGRHRHQNPHSHARKVSFTEIPPTINPFAVLLPHESQAGSPLAPVTYARSAMRLSQPTESLHSPDRLQDPSTALYLRDNNSIDLPTSGASHNHTRNRNESGDRRHRTRA